MKFLRGNFSKETFVMEKKILVVDDETDIVKVLTARLKEQGYQTEGAYGPQDALLKARQFNPDLIIMDIIMPNMSGAEVAALLKEDAKCRDVPIIFLSAILSKDEECSFGNYIGNQIIVAKPYDFQVLLDKIRNLLEFS